MKRLIIAAVLVCWGASSLALTAETKGDRQNGDVIARVGDQVITYSQLNTMLNSAPVVGLSLPALGTPERNHTMVLLLDKAISANLLYLDARAKGMDQDPAYRRALARFEAGVLADLYRADHGVGTITVTDEEVEALHARSDQAGEALTDEMRTAIEASLRKTRFKKRVATLRERLREGVDVTVDASVLDPALDAARSDEVVVATVDGVPITWVEVEERMSGVSARSRISPKTVDARAERQEQIDRVIDTRIMAARARAMGLDEDPRFTRRYDEFQKTRLINMHRKKLVWMMEPSDQELQAFFEANRASISVSESRKVQMVVLPTREEAEQVKARIDAGEITMYEAAKEHSIDPRARRTLGVIGWVGKGSGFAELDALTFSLGPAEVGGPVKSPAGWHLVTVLDLRDGAFESLDEPVTRREVRRRLIHSRLGDYAVGLRKSSFQVQVYDDVLQDLFRREAEWIQAKTREAEQDPNRVEKFMEDIKRLGGEK